jgi:hypothetical protein
MKCLHNTSISEFIKKLEQIIFRLIVVLLTIVSNIMLKIKIFVTMRLKWMHLKKYYVLYRLNIVMAPTYQYS